MRLRSEHNTKLIAGGAIMAFIALVIFVVTMVLSSSGQSELASLAERTATAQERHRAEEGYYAATLDDLAIKVDPAIMDVPANVKLSVYSTESGYVVEARGSHAVFIIGADNDGSVAYCKGPSPCESGRWKPDLKLSQ